MLTRCDTSFTMCACVFVDVATLTHKSSATAKVFFSSHVTHWREKRRPSSHARANILHPLPSLPLPFFSPPKGKEINERKGGKEGRGARLTRKGLTNEACAPPLLPSLCLVFLFPLGREKERKEKGRERTEDVGARHNNVSTLTHKHTHVVRELSQRVNIDTHTYTL